MKTGIVLCGGKSSRMGLPKASLPFGSETMLQRVVRLLSETVDGIVVVAADGQQLPELADNIRVVRDQRPERGPLEGLSAGLAACDKQTVSAYVTSCDVPFLVPEFVERMFQLLGDYEIAVPYDGKYHHPLSAVYRIEVLSYIETLLSNNRMRPVFLFDVAKTHRVLPVQWADVDPRSQSLDNLNRPEDYLRAAREAGFDVPAEVAAQLGTD
jgi:molybdopterin-guanine dinucleotide biosynthesis protein A